MDGSCEVDEDRVRAQGALVWAGARDASAPVSPAFGTDSGRNVGSNCRYVESFRVDAEPSGLKARHWK